MAGEAVEAQVAKPGFFQKILPFLKKNPKLAGAALLATAAGGGAYMMEKKEQDEFMPIEVNKAVSQMPSQNVPPPPVNFAPQQQSAQNPLIAFLKQYGVPLAAAGIGLTNDKYLPVAAGVATGYMGEKEKQKAAKAELDKEGEEIPVYIFDEATGTLLDGAGNTVNISSVPKDAKFVTRNRPYSGGGASADPMAILNSLPSGKQATAQEQAGNVLNDRLGRLRQANPNATDEQLMAYLRSEGEI
jgi:hypothetical protein